LQEGEAGHGVSKNRGTSNGMLPKGFGLFLYRDGIMFFYDLFDRTDLYRDATPNVYRCRQPNGSPFTEFYGGSTCLFMFINGEKRRLGVWLPHQYERVLELVDEFFANDIEESNIDKHVIDFKPTIEPSGNIVFQGKTLTILFHQGRIKDQFWNGFRPEITVINPTVKRVKFPLIINAFIVKSEDYGKFYSQLQMITARAQNTVGMTKIYGMRKPDAPEPKAQEKDIIVAKLLAREEKVIKISDDFWVGDGTADNLNALMTAVGSELNNYRFVEMSCVAKVVPPTESIDLQKFMCL
jgi:hypothetical protein